ILICDYFLIRKRKLNVRDLYLRNGEYEFKKGFNFKSIYALAAGVFVALIGLVIPSLRFLYDYAWFVGFAVAFALYFILMKGTTRH
ncbi:MAG: cytosine permease, partial [Bacteroidota bacterium]